MDALELDFSHLSGLKVEVEPDTPCTCGHTLGFHGHADGGVVLEHWGVPCAWGHTWPTLGEKRCDCPLYSPTTEGA